MRRRSSRCEITFISAEELEGIEGQYQEKETQQEEEEEAEGGRRRRLSRSSY